eukprot:CAMPEP_0177645266 /NCGR_PEP_ID=MMETSP0447-20121125/9158_1 /TAXON_ID=0 /ORGANISM="Stygamoeba regulata, Strain BSH-02190019" /LENGTH=618 /DNA_ID=CAMNT_0019147739 /DNA_START=912 /DNA_END=2768 /DNA_ORIENTATION=-
MSCGVDPMTLIRQDLNDITYSGVESVETLAAQLGIEPHQIVKVNANENAYGVPECVRHALAAHLCSRTPVYPDPAQEKLRAHIAEKLHQPLTAANVCAGAGSDDLLDIIIRLLQPKTIVVSNPTFGMYCFLGRLADAKVVSATRKADFAVDVDALIKLVREAEATLVFLPSPNNPTGNYLSLEEVQRICAERCVLVLDEAYADFTEKPSADSLIPSLPNLIVTRTFSKWAGLAGLRIGYALGDARLVEKMIAIKQPYNVNAAADVAAMAAIDHRDEIMKTVLAMREERNRLFELLGSFSWLRPCPSEANFVLCEVLDRSAPKLFQQFRERGILIRYFGKQGGDLENYIRISAARPCDTARIADALRDFDQERPSFDPLARSELRAALQAYGPLEAVLFDMDGVLADVSQSYRRAIISAAKRFQVDVSPEQITAAKAAGNANNDWELTHRLVSAALGEEAPSLAEVTAAFEEIYQGTSENESGLWQSESLLVKRGLLEKLAQRFPLGVVTGRPRQPDAERFVSCFDLGAYFQGMVCMNEAPAKPSPEPVRLALQRLGVSKALLVGDTVDDMRAATAAGVLAVGVVAPNVIDVVKDVNALREAGAVAVVSVGAIELLEVL